MHDSVHRTCPPGKRGQTIFLYSVIWLLQYAVPSRTATPEIHLLLLHVCGVYLLYYLALIYGLNHMKKICLLSWTYGRAFIRAAAFLLRHGLGLRHHHIFLFCCSPLLRCKLHAEYTNDHALSYHYNTPTSSSCHPPRPCYVPRVRPLSVTTGCTTYLQNQIHFFRSVFQ